LRRAQPRGFQGGRLIFEISLAASIELRQRFSRDVGSLAVYGATGYLSHAGAERFRQDRCGGFRRHLSGDIVIACFNGLLPA
jgi:hypothetical protein